MIKELLYKWFNLEPLPCQSCETYKMQLSIANHEKQELLNTILSLTRPKEPEVPQAPVDYEKLKPRMVPWSVRRRMLEDEDRKTAQLIADQKKRDSEAAKIREDIDKLESEVGIQGEQSPVGEEAKNAIQ